MWVLLLCNCNGSVRITRANECVECDAINWGYIAMLVGIGATLSCLLLFVKKSEVRPSSSRAL